MRIPRRYGAFPSRDDMVAYLEAYERFVDVPIHRGVRIEKIDPASGGWRLTTANGVWRARDVVIATGHERVPVIPPWPGRDGFTGELLHVARLGRIERFRDRRVMVVGAGNSGTDALNHLVRIETKDLWVTVRNGPTILPTRVMGIPLQLLSPLMAPLPARVTDMLMAATERLSFGNLKKIGLCKHPDGVATRLIKEGVAPAFDNGFVAALKAGRVAALPRIERFEGDAVHLAGGQTLRPDVVICATGYSPGLENMVGHLGVLNDSGTPVINGPESHPEFKGLWFMGMAPRLWGVFYAAHVEARQLATEIRKRQAASEAKTVAPTPALLARR
jgi:cation diffusion facilitator CzcD-associated flavoprotein CzcO